MTTSQMAGAKAAKASRIAMYYVGKVMSDGLDRTDQELTADCATVGYVVHKDTITHARLAFVESKDIVDSGKTRDTVSHMPSTAWVWVTGGTVPALSTSPAPPRSAPTGPTQDKKPSKKDIAEASTEIFDVLKRTDALKQLSPKSMRVLGWLETLSERTRL